PRQKMVVHVPVIRTDALRVGMAVCVDGFDGGGFEKSTNCFFSVARTRFPVVVAQRVPGWGEADLVCVGVLDNQPLKPLGVLASNAQADGTTIVLNIHAEARKADLLKERFGDGGHCVKKTRKRHAVGKMRVALAEPPCGGGLQTATSCCGQKPWW